MQDHSRALEGASFRLTTARRHQPIFHEGEPSEAVYRIDVGCVRLQVETAGGQREVVTFLFPGQIFCAGYDVHWASAYAVTDTSLAVFNLPALRTHLCQRQESVSDLLRASDDLLVDLAHHLSLSHARASSRLRWFLRWLAARSGQESSGLVLMPMSRRDIADFLGIAPETVSRTFAALEKRGELHRDASHHSVQLIGGGGGGRTRVAGHSRLA